MTKIRPEWWSTVVLPESGTLTETFWEEHDTNRDVFALGPAEAALMACKFYDREVSPGGSLKDTVVVAVILDKRLAAIPEDESTGYHAVTADQVLFFEVKREWQYLPSYSEDWVKQIPTVTT